MHPTPKGGMAEKSGRAQEQSSLPGFGKDMWYRRNI